MNREYFVRTKNGKQGPYTLEELKGMALSSSDLIWHPDFDNWMKKDDIDELKGKLKSSTPPVQSKTIKTKIADLIVEHFVLLLITIPVGAVLGLAIDAFFDEDRFTYAIKTWNTNHYLHDDIYTLAIVTFLLLFTINIIRKVTIWVVKNKSK